MFFFNISTRRVEKSSKMTEIVQVKVTRKLLLEKIAEARKKNPNSLIDIYKLFSGVIKVDKQKNCDYVYKCWKQGERLDLSGIDLILMDCIGHRLN